MNEQQVVLYEDRIDIGFRELEKIILALIWLGDEVLLPAYCRPAQSLPAADRVSMARQLAELAEGGLLKRWDIDVALPQIERSDWWPQEGELVVLSRDAYAEIQDAMSAGVSRYRQDIVRGAGHTPGTMRSGVTEIVQLRDALWSIALSRRFKADFLLAADRMSDSIVGSIGQSSVDSFRGVAAETIMRLHGIGSLASVSVRDIVKLRKYTPAIRQTLKEIAFAADRRQLLPADARRASALVIDETTKRYSDLMQSSISGGKKASSRSGAASVLTTLAGMIYPPLSALGFIEPILSLFGSRAEDRRFVVFLAKLKRVTARS